jgi:hypothetical protein
VSDAPELGLFSVFSMDAAGIEDPKLIHGVRASPEIGILTEFWISSDSIDVEHGSWDELGNPYVTDPRQPIQAEELMELHSLIVGGRPDPSTE